MSHRIHAPCPRCAGTGIRVYGNGATWRGGMGVTAMTRDVCDACWGSCDAENPNPSLREERDRLHAALRAKGAESSGRWLADRLGLEYETVRRELPAITKRLRTIRGLEAAQGALCDRLASALEDIAKATNTPGIPDNSTTAADAAKEE